MNRSKGNTVQSSPKV